MATLRNTLYTCRKHNTTIKRLFHRLDPELAAQIRAWLYFHGELIPRVADLLSRPSIFHATTAKEGTKRTIKKVTPSPPS